jgi:hypothetical protein
MRFIGGAIYCPRVQHRVQLGLEHRYGSEFVCPGCNVRIDATAYFVKHHGAAA